MYMSSFFFVLVFMYEWLMYIIMRIVNSYLNILIKMLFNVPHKYAPWHSVQPSILSKP